MDPRRFYQNLVASIPGDLERRVFEVLARHMDSPVSRGGLIWSLFGETVPDDKLAGNAHDRAIRKCIDALRLRGIPIAATSGKAGYTLVDDPALIENYIVEESYRAAHINHKIKILRRARLTARNLRQWKESKTVEAQPRLL